MWRHALTTVALVATVGLVAAVPGRPLLAAQSGSPVADAAMRSDVTLVKNLLQQGGDVNAAQGDGMTALHWAALSGNADLAQMLLYAGANPNATTRLGGYTPLHVAAKNAHAAVVEALLKGGADAKAATSDGTTALMFASEAGSLDSMTSLLDHGADVNAAESAKGETALMFASAYDRVDAVKLLLQHGANAKATSKVIDWSKLPKDDPRLSQFGRRAAPAAGAKKPGAPASAEAAETAEAAQAGLGRRAAVKAKGNADAQAAQIEELLGGYAKLVGRQGGLTPLLFAARQGNTQTVQALLDGGAEINQVDAGQHTSPLLVAVMNGHFDLAEQLLAKGADPNLAQDNGVTPLYAALNCVWAPRTLYPQPTAYRQQKTTYLQLMSDLLAHGAKPNVRLKEKVWYSGYNFDQSGVDETGATPFWRAAWADDIDAMRLLVAHGADPTIATMKPKGRVPTGTGNLDDEKAAKAKADPSGRPPVAVGGPDITPLLAASGEAYGSSFTANHHRYAPTGMLAAVKYLIEDLHADVNQADADGNTALHNAAARGDNEMILYLVAKGADVKAVNRRGQTIPDLANGPIQRISPFPETIALLQRLGARLAHKCLSCG